MPPWLAPNLITLIGFSAILLNFTTVAIFNSDLIGPAGSWVYFSCAFGLFFYWCADAIDGKQARATGTSSPLGEVVDHGLDTLNCESSAMDLFGAKPVRRQPCSATDPTDGNATCSS